MPTQGLPIIYMIDTSGSMGGDRIAAVNDAMRESIKVIKEKAEDSPDAEIMIGVLKFATGAEWVTPGLVKLEHFYWDDLTAGGLTDFGCALKELDDKMSKTSYLKSEIGYAVPVIICMSDGQPTDSWEGRLEEVKKNNAWFRGARKVCIAIGDDADVDMLGKLCGNPKEGVIRSSDLEALKAFIVAVSATASMMGQSRMKNDDKPLVEEAKKLVDDKDANKLEELPVTAPADELTETKQDDTDPDDPDWK